MILRGSNGQAVKLFAFVAILPWPPIYSRTSDWKRASAYLLSTLDFAGCTCQKYRRCTAPQNSCSNQTRLGCSLRISDGLGTGLVLHKLSIVHAVPTFYLLTLAKHRCFSIPSTFAASQILHKTQVLGCVRWLSMLVDCSHGRNGLTSKIES